MPTQSRGESHEFRMKVFGGTVVMTWDGPQGCPCVAIDRSVATFEEGREKAQACMTRAREACEAGGRWTQEVDWVGAAVYDNGIPIWKVGFTYTDEQITAAEEAALSE